MSRKVIKQAIAGHMAAAAEQAAAVCVHRDDGTLTRLELEDRLRRYVLFKFRLDASEARDVQGREIISIASLAQLSLDKALRADPARAAAETRAATCDGADSVDVKQALLLMAMQKDFDAKLDGFAMALADTTEDLAALIWKSYKAGDCL